MPHRPTLTEVELAVLQEVARGRDNHQIATLQFRSVETIRTHMKNILYKLGARNRAHAVAIAYHTGIFQGRAISTNQTPPTPAAPNGPRPQPTDSAQHHATRLTSQPNPSAPSSPSARRERDHP